MEPLSAPLRSGMLAQRGLMGADFADRHAILAPNGCLATWIGRPRTCGALSRFGGQQGSGLIELYEVAAGVVEYGDGWTVLHLLHTGRKLERLFWMANSSEHCSSSVSFEETTRVIDHHLTYCVFRDTHLTQHGKNLAADEEKAVGVAPPYLL